AILMTVYLRARFSPERFEASAILYYNPKQTGKISSYNSQYVLQVLARRDIRQKFLRESGLDRRDRKKPRPKLTVAAVGQRNRNADRFEVRVSSRHYQTAISLTNALAEYCIRAYIENRTANLLKMKQALQQKKNDIFMEIQKLDREKNAMGVPLNSVALDREYEQLRLRIGEQNMAHTRLKLAIGSLEKRCATIRKRHEQLNPALIANEKLLREQIDALKKLDQEIMLAENLYTSDNPKMITLTTRRESMRERLRKFLNEKKIAEDDFEHFEEIFELTAAMKKNNDELELRRDEMRLLEQELKETGDRFERLCEIMPRIQVINQQYANLKDSLQKLDASLSDINYLLPLVKDDLRLGEPSTSAYGMMPFTKKNVFVCVFAAISLTLLLASLTVLLEYWLGKVTGDRELSIIPELRYLGKLPAADGLFESKRQEQIAFSTICHNFRSGETEHHVVLAGNLPGGKLLPSLFDAFEWTYAMAGKRTLAIDMVLADNFDYEAYPPGDTGIIVYSGGKGFLPVVSKHYLSPSELMLLKQDLEILRKSYDLVFLKHSVSLRHDRLFLEQIIGLCDGALLAVGA
ncbi:MAG: hypothetical protein IJJ28_04970, partial [Lentisphaeria bacterium]|nr:hypothetical protein [Lentisphaeria bacterium]